MFHTPPTSTPTPTPPTQTQKKQAQEGGAAGGSATTEQDPAAQTRQEGMENAEQVATEKNARANA